MSVDRLTQRHNARKKPTMDCQYEIEMSLIYLLITVCECFMFVGTDNAIILTITAALFTRCTTNSFTWRAAVIIMCDCACEHTCRIFLG